MQPGTKYKTNMWCVSVPYRFTWLSNWETHRTKKECATEKV